jgi:hypothetical protein
MSLIKRVALVFTMGMFFGTNISISNGSTLLTAIRDGLFFSIIISFVVILIDWGINIAKEKCYPIWIGFVLALLLNVIGILILKLLPIRTNTNSTG